MHQPAHRLYPGRRSLDLLTSDRRISHDYRLYADDFGQAGSVLDGPVRAWLPEALSLRIGNRPIVTLEVSGTWAMVAVQAEGAADPDALLAVLRQFREKVPAAWRRRTR